jgi:hypothetical protein
MGASWEGNSASAKEYHTPKLDLVMGWIGCRKNRHLENAI